MKIVLHHNTEDHETINTAKAHRPRLTDAPSSAPLRSWMAPLCADVAFVQSCKSNLHTHTHTCLYVGAPFAIPPLFNVWLLLAWSATASARNMAGRDRSSRTSGLWPR